MLAIALPMLVLVPNCSIAHNYVTLQVTDTDDIFANTIIAFTISYALRLEAIPSIAYQLI